MASAAPSSLAGPQLSLALARLEETAERLEAAMQQNEAANRRSNEVLATMQTNLLQMRKRVGPINDRATVLTWAHDNIKATKAATDELLQCIDTSRRVGVSGGTACARGGACMRGRCSCA